MRDILFVIDDLELKYFEFNDVVTDFWFIKEFLKRDYNVSVAIKSDLFIENKKGCVFSHYAYLKEENIFYNKERIKRDINSFKTVFFRPDPPVNIDYINACFVFDYVDKDKTLVINNPCEVRNFNEKFHINCFPDYIPENIITSDTDLIVDFVETHEEAILKPLNRCFGSGVYYLNKKDKNILTIINSMTNDGRTLVMIQEYLKEAKNGDKRVLIIGNSVMEECIQKLPAENNFKFSKHSDEYFRPAMLSEYEKHMAMDIADRLSELGIYLAGLDVISGKVKEINVTSPCYFIREINKNYGIRFENKIISHIEALIENHFESTKTYAVKK